MGYSRAHISMRDSTTQTIAVANTPQLITFNTTVRNDKIIATSSSRFTVNEAGDYLINGNAQVTASVANKTLDIWIRINGTDVNNTNSKQTVVNNEIDSLPIGGEAITLAAGQYFEFWMSGDSTSLNLVAFAAGVSPTRPATPSIFFTAEKIHPY